MKIKTDSREPKKMEKYLSDFGFEVERQKLDVGDYQSDDILVERKTIPDFCGTIINGKLENYCNRLMRSDKYIFWIFVQGEIRGITGNQLWGAIASLSLRYGFPVIGPLPNDAVCAYVIGSILSKSKKIGRPYKCSIKPNDKIQLIENVLRIPHSSAEELHEKYNGSVKTILETIADNPKEIKEISGIGKKRLESMRNIVGEFK